MDTSNSFSKKILACASLFFLFFLVNTPNVSAQIVVKVRPAQPKVIVKRPAQARSGHVWVDGHWHHDGKRYVWRKGDWVKARSGHNWVAGKWVTCKGGHNWVPGAWQPVRVVKKSPKKVVVVKKKKHHHHGKHKHGHKHH